MSSFNELAMKTIKQGEFVLRKNAPTILTGVGVGGFIATTAFTIRATAKAIDAMPGISKRVMAAREKATVENLNARDASTELAKAYVENSVQLVKIYGVTFALGSASIISVLAGHGIMLRRQANLVALYAALDTSYRAYRERVAKHIGADEERQLFRGPKIREVEQLEGDEGEPACIIDMSDSLPSPYAKFFDQSSKNWSHTPEYNLMFLKGQQEYANHRLTADGYLFLNDVYKSLGIPRTQAGQIVGWKSVENGGKDGYVDFGIYDPNDEIKREFVNGYGDALMLDFNVDGIISI